MNTPIPKVVLDSIPKQKPTYTKFDIFMGFFALVIFIFAYIAIWADWIYLKICLTLLLTFIVINSFKNRK